MIPELEARDPKVEALIVTMYCHRAWPILAWAPVGRCGECGERPTA